MAPPGSAASRRGFQGSLQWPLLGQTHVDTKASGARPASCRQSWDGTGDFRVPGSALSRTRPSIPALVPQSWGALPLYPHFADVDRGLREGRWGTVSWSDAIILLCDQLPDGNGRKGVPGVLALDAAEVGPTAGPDGFGAQAQAGGQGPGLGLTGVHCGWCPAAGDQVWGGVGSPMALPRPWGGAACLWP